MDQQTPNSATLHVVTMPPPNTGETCDDTYTCACERCTMDKAQRVARGIRRQPSVPLKRAA